MLKMENEQMITNYCITCTCFPVRITYLTLIHVLESTILCGNAISHDFDNTGVV